MFIKIAQNNTTRTLKPPFSTVLPNQTNSEINNTKPKALLKLPHSVMSGRIREVRAEPQVIKFNDIEIPFSITKVEVDGKTVKYLKPEVNWRSIPSGSKRSLVDQLIKEAEKHDGVILCLEMVNLEGVNLEGINLANANLWGINLTNSRLTNADLTNANLERSRLINADLTNSRLTNADLTDADLTNTKLSNANLTGANLTLACLTGTNLRGANLTNTLFYSHSRDPFTNVVLDELPHGFKSSNEELSKLNRNQLLGWLQNFRGENGVYELIDMDFSELDLSYLDLTLANLTNTNLHGTNLTNANLTGANLTNTKVTNANLTNADLSYVDLTGINLDNVILDGIKNADLRVVENPESIHSDRVSPSSLTLNSFSESLKQAFNSSDAYDEIPHLQHTSFLLLKEIIEAAQSQNIQIENKSGLSLVLETVSKPENINLLTELLAQSRDVDAGIKKDAFAILKNASPQELELIGNNITNGLNDRNIQAFLAFYYSAQHLSDNGSLLCKTFQEVYKQNIEKNLKPETKTLINELLSGNSNPVRQKKFDGLDHCLENPQLELLLDFFLTDNNKYKQLGTFLDLAHQINFFNGILEINSEAPIFDFDLVSSTKKPDFSPAGVGDYLSLIPEHEKSKVQIELKTKKTANEKIEFLKKYFTENNIDFSKLKPKLSVQWYQEKLLSKLTELVDTKRQEALKKVLSEFNIKKEVLNKFPDEDVEGLIQASAYYKTAHSNPNEKAIFANLIKQTLQGDIRKLILDKAKPWINEVKQTNTHFKENNLRKSYSQTIGKYTIEIEPEAINYFNMSNELAEHSCLNVTNGGNKDKVLNHVLNAHTVLIWIKDESGNKLARQLVSILKDGSLAGYPVYLFDGAGNKTEISTATQEFAKMYRGFLGLTNTKQVDYEKPTSMFNLPAYYDSTIWQVSETINPKNTA